MTIDELKASTNVTGMPPLVQALWHDARGDWDAAHRLAQDVDDEDGAWVHAYLHRKEGDLGNAAYWYDRAKQPVAADALDAEWQRVAHHLLGRMAAAE
jgi:hypothetical protein